MGRAGAAGISQGLLPYVYEDDAGTAGATALAGLTVLPNLMVAADHGGSIAQHVAIRTKGRARGNLAADVSLIVPNIAGGRLGGRPEDARGR